MFRLKSSGIEAACASSPRWVARVAALLLFVASAGAFAIDIPDEESPFPKPPSVDIKSVVDAINLVDFPEPKGLRYGNFKVNPYLAFDSTFTDNSARSAHNKTSDFLLEYTTGYNAIFRPHELIRANINYEFGWHDYAWDTQRDYLSHMASFGLVLDRVGVEGLSITFGDQYLQTANSSALENEIIQFARYQTNRSNIRTQYKFDRFRISGDYAYSFTDYFEELTTGQANYRTQTGTLEGAWQWLPGRPRDIRKFSASADTFRSQRFRGF